MAMGQLNETVMKELALMFFKEHHRIFQLQEKNRLENLQVLVFVRRPNLIFLSVGSKKSKLIRILISASQIIQMVQLAFWVLPGSKMVLCFIVQIQKMAAVMPLKTVMEINILIGEEVRRVPVVEFPRTMFP
jgi:hypothetical protein